MADNATAGAGAAGAADGKAVAPAPVKTSIADPAAVKHTLDEQAVDFFVDNLNYTEDVSLSNIKLAIGFAAVLVALGAQFYPVPFPQSRDVLLVATCVYWILHSAVAVMSYFTECDAILITKSKLVMSDSGVSRRVAPLLLMTDMKRYETSYSLTLSYRASAKSKDKAVVAAGSHTKTIEVTDFFDANGVFLTAPFHAVMNSFVSEFLAGAKLE